MLRGCTASDGYRVSRHRCGPDLAVLRWAAARSGAAEDGGYVVSIRQVAAPLVLKGLNFQARLTSIQRQNGRRAAVHYAYRASRTFVTERVLDVLDRLHDSRTGYDTASDRSVIPHNARHQDGKRFERTLTRDFKGVVRDLSIQPSLYTFIDLGCGKGGVTLLAGRCGFRSVVGVELDARLAAIARENVVRFRSREGVLTEINIVECDAVEFDFPDTPLIVYLFNPFGIATMNAVLDRLELSLQQNPRDAYVAYLNPEHVSVLARRTSLTRCPTRSSRWAVFCSHMGG